MAPDREWRKAWLECDRFAFGMSPRERDPAATLRALAERAPDGHQVDRYGGGELAERLERRVAELLGKEAAVWMPSGTMAQQIALRIHAGRRNRDTVAFHPHCHVEAHEERGYQALHGLRAVLIGDRDRLIETSDVEKLGEPVAALLLELPQRDLGGSLPEWGDLVATCSAAREGGAALHLDGARLWQCGPFFDRPLAEIAALFDTVYVSFYKDLGAPAGCALAGPEELVAEARVWQVRHGGRLFSAFPYLVAAEIGLDTVLPRMPELVARAGAAAGALAAIDGVAVVPDPPQVAMFHVLVRRPLETLNDAVLAVAGETRTWPGAEFGATGDPEVQRAEVAVTVANLDVPLEELTALWQDVLSRAVPASA
jgi:threonine aldolase